MTENPISVFLSLKTKLLLWSSSSFLSHQLFIPCGSSIKEEFMPTDGRFFTTQKLKWERSEIQLQNRGTIPIPTCGEKEDRPWNPPAHTVPISCSIAFFLLPVEGGWMPTPFSQAKKNFSRPLGTYAFLQAKVCKNNNTPTKTFLRFWRSTTAEEGNRTSLLRL